MTTTRKVSLAVCAIMVGMSVSARSDDDQGLISWSADAEIFPVEWTKAPFHATAEPVQPSQRTRAQAVIRRAVQKYPDLLIKKTLRRVFVLSKFTSFKNAEFSGTASAEAVYLVVRPEDEGYSDRFVEATFHREYSTLLLNRYLKHLDQSSWNAINPKGFRYLGGNSWDGVNGKDGGAQAIANGEASLAPQQGSRYLDYGFLTEYSRSSLENDFNEHAAALLMNDPGFHELAEQYPGVARKRDLVIGFYCAVAPEMDADYFKKSHDEKETKLPEVLLIGDSISIGYTPHVAEILNGKAAVRHHRGNAGHTGMGLENIDRWIGKTEWDVIHFNWGLWDLCYRHPESRVQGNRDKVNGKVTHTLAQYERNLEQLVIRLKETNATLIWAHTTVVPENEAGRIEGDDLKYNDVATDIMNRHGVHINDLHALSRSFPPGLFKGPGDVHYSKDGYHELAMQVADEILSRLDGE